MLEKILENPLESKETKPINLKGSQPCILIGRTDAEAKVPILWPPDEKSQFIGKDPDEKEPRQKEKRAAEDEIDRTTDLMDLNLCKLWEIVEDRRAWHIVIHGVKKSQTGPSN